MNTTLENWESRPDLPPKADWSAPNPEEHRRAPLFSAREYVGQNAAGALFADVAPPQEDGEHYPWTHDGDGEWSRFFVGTTRELGETHVMIVGNQSSEGTISRAITVDGEERQECARGQSRVDERGIGQVGEAVPARSGIGCGAVTVGARYRCAHRRTAGDPAPAPARSACARSALSSS